MSRNQSIHRLKEILRAVWFFFQGWAVIFFDFSAFQGLFDSGFLNKKSPLRPVPISAGEGSKKIIQFLETFLCWSITPSTEGCIWGPSKRVSPPLDSFASKRAAALASPSFPIFAFCGQKLSVEHSSPARPVGGFVCSDVLLLLRFLIDWKYKENCRVNKSPSEGDVGEIRGKQNLSRDLKEEGKQGGKHDSPVQGFLYAMAESLRSCAGFFFPHVTWGRREP